jgi:signal transduction histidine kinase
MEVAPCAHPGAKPGRVRRAELCERANVGRSNFYTHFADKEELEVVGRLESEAERAGSEVHVRVREVVGCWDRTRLDQIVTNLVGNAIKYGDGKPIEVTVDERDGAAALLVVRDQGIGISPESHARIFERFERAADTRPVAGLGLGLWIAKRLDEAHGGEIAVTSAPGAGATFTVTLPRPRA